MTAPPSHAPIALPRLKAAMLKDEARPWPAPSALASTHICSGATVAKAAAPNRAIAITISTGWWMTAVMARSTTASAIRLPTMVGIR
ncbi:hypothetical protein D3C87_1843730 [compost metagenome]